MVDADPQARAALAALDATTRDLAELPGWEFDPSHGPTPRMPEHVAARIDAALAAEAASWRPAAQTETGTSAVVVDIAAARRRRQRRLIGWGVGVLATAAAAVGIVIATVPSPAHPGGNGVAAGPPTTPALALRSGGLTLQVAFNAVKKSDYGPLTDATRLSACLSANGLDPSHQPVGAEQITLDGQPGVLLVAPTGQVAQFRLLVVRPDCGSGNPATLANVVVGGLSGLPVPVPSR
jgi:hypothetical protein